MGVERQLRMATGPDIRWGARREKLEAIDGVLRLRELMAQEAVWEMAWGSSAGYYEKAHDIQRNSSMTGRLSDGSGVICAAEGGSAGCWRGRAEVLARRYHNTPDNFLCPKQTRHIIPTNSTNHPSQLCLST